MASNRLKTAPKPASNIVLPDSQSARTKRVSKIENEGKILDGFR